MFFEQQIAQIRQAIDDHFESHPNLKAANQKLKSAPGVGEKNAPFLLVTYHRFASLTANKGSGKSLTAYVGLDPVPYESGTSLNKHRGISREGNKRIRRYLFLGALGGVRGNNPLKLFYQRLVGRGKPKKVALIASARKILIWSWAIFINDTTFDPKQLGQSA